MAHRLLAAAPALAAALLTAPYFARNLAWYGPTHPLGVQLAEDGGDQANAAFTPALTVSNVIRNAASHFAGPWPGWNERLEHAVRSMHSWLGLSADDPRNTIWVMKFAVKWVPGAETIAGAPWHVVLIAAAVLGAWFWPGARDWRWLATVVAAMALLYCAVVRWQLWGARLQLPGFVTGSLLAAALVGTLPPRWRSPAVWGAAALGLLAWWPAHETTARPLWTRPTLAETSRVVNMYRYHPDFLARDTALAEMVHAAGVREVEIVALHDIAYPLMQRLQTADSGLHFYGAPVSDVARNPAAIIVLNLGEPLALFHAQADGTRYRLVGAGAGDGLYLPETRVHALGWDRQLPAFAGWTVEEALPLMVDEPVNLGAPVCHRIMTTTTAGVIFPGWTGRARLAGTVRTTATTGWFDVSINGAPAIRVDLPGAGSHNFEVPLPIQPGGNRIELRRPPGADAILDFYRLTIDDGAGT